MYEINEEQIKTWWDVFVCDNNLVEVRLLGKTTYSGYFRDVNVLIEKLRPLLNTFNPYDGNLQAYFTLNRINGDLYSREQRDTFVKKPKSTTADDCVERRIKVMIDLDPKRAAGISSSDDELEKSHLKAVAIYRYLLEQGFKEPIITISGSGYHLYLPCDMPNDDEHNELVKRFLQSMGKMFSDDCIELDEKVFNPARVSKILGTWAKKGADGDDRRWRMAKVVKVPQDLTPNEDALFQKIADLLPKEEPQQAPQRRTYNGVAQQFDLPTWLNTYGIKYKVDKQGTSTRYTLEECPWIENHSDRKKWDSALFVDTQGKVCFNCQHSHCAGKTWHDVRLKCEPDAYTKQETMYRPMSFRYQQPQKKYEIKDEIPELGEKWLSLSSIKKVNLEEMEKVKTGFAELDKQIGGLFMTDLTVLSGGNACVDCETEYFNGVEWKKISEYTFGDKVLQYNIDGSAELVTPQRYIKSPCDELYLLQSVTGVNQCVSGNHNLVYMTSKGHLAKKSVSETINMHNNSVKGFGGRFYTTFKYKCGNGIKLTDDEIRVMCAVICDGSFSNKYKDKNTVRINLKKERKKKRLEMLLNNAGISYRKEQYTPNDLQYNSYIFHSPLITKEFTCEWYSCTAEQFAVVADEILYWDGKIDNSKRGTTSFSSTNKKNIDFIQYAFATTGTRTSISVDDRVGKPHMGGKYFYKKICYNLTICRVKNPSLMNPVKKKEIEKVKTKDGFKYCFTVPSGMLVLRRCGNINITGNSGKSSWLNVLILNVIQQKYKVALWTGELSPTLFKSWFLMSAAGKDNVRPSKYEEGRYYVPDNVAAKIDQWLDGKFYVYNNDYGTNAEQILHDMEILSKKDVRFFVLDNLMSLEIDLLGNDKNTQQKTLLSRLKEFAQKNNAHIVIVAHPRKTLAFLRKADISGTADIANLVGNVFIIHRVNNDFLKAVTEFYNAQKKEDEFRKFGNVITVEKNRIYGSCDLMIGMYYEMESRRFKNTEFENIKYGWEQEPQETPITFQNQVGGTSDYTVQENATQGLKTAKFDTYKQQEQNYNDPFGFEPIGECPF